MEEFKSERKITNASHNVVYVNVESHSSLLNDGKWPYYFNEEGCQICSCEVWKGRKMVNAKLRY